MQRWRAPAEMKVNSRNSLAPVATLLHAFVTGISAAAPSWSPFDIFGHRDENIKQQESCKRISNDVWNTCSVAPSNQ